MNCFGLGNVTPLPPTSLRRILITRLTATFLSDKEQIREGESRAGGVFSVEVALQLLIQYLKLVWKLFLSKGNPYPSPLHLYSSSWNLRTSNGRMFFHCCCVYLAAELVLIKGLKGIVLSQNFCQSSCTHPQVVPNWSRKNIFWRMLVNKP